MVFKLSDENREPKKFLLKKSGVTKNSDLKKF